MIYEIILLPCAYVSVFLLRAVFLENALVREAPADLHSRALVAFLATSAAHGAAFTAAYCHRPSLFERMLGHVDSGARDAAGRLLGTLSSGMTPHQLQALVDGLCGTVRAALDGKKVRFEEVDGGTSALGYIASQLMCSAEGSSGALVERTLGTLRDDLTSTTIDPQLRATAAVALGCAALPLRVSKASGSAAPGVAVPDAPTLATATAALLEDKVKDPKVAKRLVQALGFLAYGSCADSAVTSTTVDALLALRTSKSEEVLLASGEALALVFGGVGISADDILRTPFTSLADWSQQGRGDKGATENETKNKIDKAAGPGESEAMELDGATVPVVPGHGCDPLPLPQCILDAQQRILATVLDECVGHSRPEVRCAGATWLVSLLLFCGTTPAVVSLLPRAQEALGVLLGDESEMTQEMASRGLAACYELADDATRAALVESLVGVLSGAPGRKRRAGDVTGDTQVFEPGTLGNVPGGGGLGTYKEICALATDLGQPDLVYRFMQLANHQAAANASRGAAFGFASVAKLAGDALAPHVGALVPRLYRSLYDPQPKVRDAMKHIWTALVDDPRAELTKHFDAVCAALITDMGSNQWKVREAAALAAADVIQGRRWPELRPHFASLWGAALRVMDDIKETVRQAGMSLVRCMRGLTLRLADPDLTPASESKEAVSASLPLLLELALPSRVAEVQALGVDTTARLVKAAGAEVIRPHLRILIPAMLESLR